MGPWRRIREWLRPDSPTPEYRAWKLAQQQALSAFADNFFRIVEMTLVTGAIYYLEEKLHANHLTSLSLSALVAIYARGKATAATLPAIETYEISEARRRQIYWLFWGLVLLIFAGINQLVTTIVPVLAANQAP